MITKGQAGCLVLDLIPSIENRAKAKEILRDGPFDVTYLAGSDPLRPMAMGKAVMLKNPFVYKTYPDTPPVSPVLTPTQQVECSDVSDNESDSSDSSDDVTANYTKSDIMDLAKTTFVNKDPENPAVWDYRFMTNKEIFQTMASRIPKLPQKYTEHQFSLWLNENKDHFGATKRRRTEEKNLQGRNLWVLKEFVPE
ncbi:hypothetical protein BCR42DRAFT_101685 [Absidia repens]|uniref:Uncharacterized protein n=1 Tax=Absidia repens TaxID=90262 RepID=A0A1X2I8L4_9FUNG|nr:hypothetical protein BCR42DRAFT_101685 [Absidia repens]